MAKCPICDSGVVVHKAGEKWALCSKHRREYPEPRFALLGDGCVVDTDTGRVFKDDVWIE